MAISHVQPLLLLLASLFFLPVLRAIRFGYCNDNNGYDFGNITRVTINAKDYDTTIFIYGTASKSLQEGTVLVVLMIGRGEPIDMRFYRLSEVAKVLPIKPGSNFVLTLTKVPFQDSLTYDEITVNLYDDNGESDHGEKIEIMCINFNPYSSITSTSLSE
ncbi:hypothetical protein AALP_AA4G087100 [Arabis alpina]|uniref:MD-2-related lipid-recognition domain-containing protein n=1 Tax=Arabis alpina TaxID=50452 RepID=A0A087H218_ARAAL|nr:hypothetical protein AALP_AA4G087100 [Arabis alpina]